MNLGGSLRRRRPQEGRVPRPKPSKAASLIAGRGRLFLVGLAVVVIGSGTGYLYATQVVFPGTEDVVGSYLEIPDLRGLTLADVETLLADRGLEIGAVDSVHHPEVPPGEVLGQSPLPGQLAVPAGLIGLTLSRGPERRPIPDVTRLRGDRALTVLQTTGFVVVVDSLETELPAGRVVSTDPAPGEELALPAEVRLTVSLGPPSFAMPDLVGLQEDQARMLLDSLGLDVSEVESRFRFGFNQGEVLEHFPLSDSLVSSGTSVRLVIGRRGFFEDPVDGN